MIKGDDVRANNDSQEDKNRRREDDGLAAKYRSGAIIVLVLLLVALLLWVASSLSEPPVECVTMRKALARIPMEGPDETFSFIDDQVIVTGPASEFREVLDGFDLELIRKCDLNYLDGASGRMDETQQRLPFLDGARGKLTMRLYRIGSGGSVTEVVQAINSAGRSSQVYADPNLLTGHSVCGNPEHTGGGSPFGGIPDLLPVGEEAAVKLFWDQWAFQQVGVGWWFKRELAGAAAAHHGEGVLVGVFDTSPFPDPWNGVANGEGAPVIDTREVVKWVNPTMDVEPLTLKVSYPKMINTIAANDSVTVTNEMTPVGDVRDHGLFVAGLVHAVAPASDLRLIRVLNEIGCGDLFTLNEALMRFIGEVERERGTLNGVVINLSLGVRDNLTSGIHAQEDLTLARCGSGDRGDEIVSLCITLFDARDKGAVIVAAAGNESNGDGDPPSAQIPAAYGFVFGVEASNQNGERACFSNEGDVRAPGGEGGPVKDVLCASVVGECFDESNLNQAGDCAEGVIGPVLFPPEGSAYWSTHYGYWSGTSFATPLVSGLAALILQAEGVPAGTSSGPTASSSNQNLVTMTIRCGAATLEGVINVPVTLTDDCLP
ncbi:MAG: S8 family serine peptidase [Chloroflexota bacterium]|nr:S8 family serine peptidase [Chloroflexota bacterium]